MGRSSLWILPDESNVMYYERNITLKTGRDVKLIVPQLTQTNIDPATDAQVLIKDPGETKFHPPIELSHPKYWKLKNLDTEGARALQLKYSGVTDKEIRKTRKEILDTLLQSC